MFLFTNKSLKIKIKIDLIVTKKSKKTQMFEFGCKAIVSYNLEFNIYMYVI